MDKKQNNLSDFKLIYKSKASFIFLIWLISSGVICFLTVSVIGNLSDSMLIGWTVGILLTVSYLFYQTNNFKTVVITEDNILIEYPYSLFRNRVTINYNYVLCAYFYCGPFGLNYPAVFIQYKRNGIISKIGFAEYNPSNIKKVLDSISKHNIKTGILSDSTDYLDLKSKLNVIQPI
ncbi:MAG: hypothetical protein POELPBGB_01993 [Bacteroidia bacterium]|nr:hypothetical protein [Bacteroidia bacterium]